MAPGPKNADHNSHWRRTSWRAASRGHRGKKDAAIQHLREAVMLQDEMDYTEPPDWFYPTRESLGGELLQAGNAAEAEKLFRDDLQSNPRNPRSLFGLMQALKAQGREHDAEWWDSSSRQRGKMRI